MQQSEAGTTGDRMFLDGSIHHYGTDGSTKKKTNSSLPDESYKHGVFYTGQSTQLNKNEVSKKTELHRRGQRKKNPTVKWIE